MTRDAVLKRIYHKLITEGECVLHNPDNLEYTYVRIRWLDNSADKALMEGYEITTKNNKEHGHGWESRQFAPELGMLTPWLRRHFAEFGTAGTDKDHQVWKEALGL